MSTDYSFICHSHKHIIELGKFGQAEDALPGVLKHHKNCNFNIGENSDYIPFNIYDTEYAYDNNDKLKDKYVDKSKDKNPFDFIDFYKKHRICD